MEKIFEYILMFGAGQGLLLSIFLFRKKENTVANKMLAVTMLAFAVDLFAVSRFLTDFYFDYPHMIGISASFPFFYAAAIYVYTKLVVDCDAGFRKSYLLHFLPFIIFNLLGFIFVYFESAEFKLSLIDESKNLHPLVYYFQLLIPYYGLLYVYLTIRETQKFNRKIEDSFSNIDKINLKWLEQVVAWTAMIWVIVFLSFVITAVDLNIFIYLGLSIFLYTLGFKALHQPEAHFTETDNCIESTEQGNSSEVYKKSGLTDEFAEEVSQKLDSLMHEEKLFKDTSLKLSDLAGRLGVSTHNLSEVLNTRHRQNFYNYINSFRVREVQNLIINDMEKKYTLLALAYDAGFSSKSTFNSIFKKHSGLTPSDYRKNLLADGEEQAGREGTD